MDHETAEFYRLRAAEWAAALPHAWSRQLDAFLDGLEPGARILELGCGDGRDAARMIARGFAVDPSDGAPEMARLASARLGREVPVMRFDRLEAEGQYDAVWANASLLHVPGAKLPAILGRVHRALKPGGWHFASYKSEPGGTGEGHRDEHGRYYSYISEDALRTAYGAHEWRSLAVRHGLGGSFGGVPTEWLNVTARR